jgi:hypothetical protein
MGESTLFSMKGKPNKNKGLVAIFPAIIISSLLILMCASISRSFLAFLYRTILYQDKVQADIFVRACEERVSLKLVHDEAFNFADVIKVGKEPVAICHVDDSDPQKIILTVYLGNAKSQRYVVR